jgi:putative tryptophan/tyrosine transport system substrate-binding protein
VRIEYHWVNDQSDRLPAPVADLVRRRLAVIATPGSALAAKAATAKIPIVFSAAEDPVALGLIASFAWLGGNATGINSFVQEEVGKRLGLLPEPKTIRVAMLVNPASAPNTETTVRDAKKAASTIGLQSRSSTPTRAQV